MARKRKKHPDSEVELGRVITPFLDMAFQILFFFVMQYQPSAMEGQMDMALPAAGEGVAKDRPDRSSTDTLIELPAELEVIIRTQEIGEAEKVEGTISRILIKDPAGAEKPVGNHPDQLRVYLEKVRTTLNNRDDIKVQGDGRLKYEYVIQVMDVCRRVGFKNVAFAPPHDLQRIIPGVP